jgi:translation initiation factor IF-2
MRPVLLTLVVWSGVSLLLALMIGRVLQGWRPRPPRPQIVAAISATAATAALVVFALAAPPLHDGDGRKRLAPESARLAPATVFPAEALRGARAQRRLGGLRAGVLPVALPGAAGLGQPGSSPGGDAGPVPGGGPRPGPRRGAGNGGGGGGGAPGVPVTPAAPVGPSAPPAASNPTPAPSPSPATTRPEPTPATPAPPSLPIAGGGDDNDQGTASGRSQPGPLTPRAGQGPRRTVTARR